MAEQKAKIGAGHASAWFRQGLRELRAIFFPESNVAQQTEYGIFGTKTPGEVASGRQPDSQASRMDQEPAAVASPPQRTPSDIAADARNDKGQDRGGGIDGHAAGNASVHGTAPRSPSEIAANRSAYVPEQQHQNDLSHGM